MYYIIYVYKVLRIICCLLAALSAAAALFIFVYLGWLWGIACVACAVGFSLLMILFKGLQERKDNKGKPKEEIGDFITPKKN